MSVFIFDGDTDKLCVQFFRPNHPKIFINEPLAQCAVSFKCWFIWIRLWVEAYESLATKEKSSWVIPKVIAVAYESFSLKKFKSQFKRGFTKVVVTSARRLRVWTQGELRLYTGKSVKEMIKFTTAIERILLRSFVKTVI